MEPYVIAVNPFENRKEAYSSSSGMRETLKHLQNGGCVGIFLQEKFLTRTILTEKF
jgi:hypothetical protein